MRTLLSALLLATLTSTPAAAFTLPTVPHLTVLRHGTIFTGDPAAPFAESIAILGDRVLVAGDDDLVALIALFASKRVELGGRAVIPGINDAHVHVVVPPGAYLNAPDFIPGPGPDLAAVQGLLAGGAAQIPAGQWLFAFVGSAVSDDPAVERFALDAVTPHHPVALFAWSGHGIWLNTRALTVLGISPTEPDPFGGFWTRYDSGNGEGSLAPPGLLASGDLITGQAHEYAEFRVRKALLDQVPDPVLVGMYQGYAAAAARLGVTSIQDMAVGLTHHRATRVIAAANVGLRVRSMCFPLALDEPCRAGPIAPRVTASGVKWISDGTPIERLAYLDGEYADRPGESGFFDLGDALPQILDAHLDEPAVSDQLLFHAVGDGAIGHILDALDAYTTGPAHHRKNPWKARRTRIEHGDLLPMADIARVARLGVVIVQNPLHFTLTGLYLERFDAQTFNELEPMRSLLAAGVPLALGSDSIGVPSNPYLDMFLAIIHPTRPSEGLTLVQAVTAYTRGSAFAEYAEQHKGRLVTGQLADLAVLSQDIFALPPTALPATTSVLTLVGGQVIWDAGQL